MNRFILKFIVFSLFTTGLVIARQQLITAPDVDRNPSALPAPTQLVESQTLRAGAVAKSQRLAQIMEELTTPPPSIHTADSFSE